MTPERINQVIAEILGWTIRQVYVDGTKDIVILPPGVECSGENAFNYAGTSIPNFYGDLNACADMERALTPTAQSLMYTYLAEVCERPGLLVDGGIYLPLTTPTWRATAHQRCESFLRVHEKWEEA